MKEGTVSESAEIKMIPLTRQEQPIRPLNVIKKRRRYIFRIRENFIFGAQLGN